VCSQRSTAETFIARQRPGKHLPPFVLSSHPTFWPYVFSIQPARRHHSKATHGGSCLSLHVSQLPVCQSTSHPAPSGTEFNFRKLYARMWNFTTFWRFICPTGNNFFLTSLTEYCRLSQWLKTGFGLVIGFINNLQVVTAINYYTLADLHNVQSLHTNLFSLSALVLTKSHTPNITVLQHTQSLQITR
jgi:hypothetical protein